MNRSMPIVLHRTSEGERVSMDIYTRLLTDRIICVNDNIDTVVSGLVVAQLLYLQSEDKLKSIDMYINSPGGEVTAGLAIYDTMQTITPAINTYCIGQACSMGSLLLAAGTGQRKALPNSRIMIHQPLGGAQGQVTDMQIRMEEMQRLKHSLNMIYSVHCSQPIEVIEKAVERDNFMTPDQAKEFGIIDSVVKRPVKTAS